MSLRLEDNNTALIRNAWDANLQDESQEYDILSKLTSYNAAPPKEGMEVPDAIVAEIDMAGYNTKTIGLLIDLTGSGTQGDGTVTTEAQALKYLTLYAANVRHGVTNDMFGRQASLQEFYNMLGRATNQIGKWMQARMGKHMRQAHLEKVSDNLVITPHSLTAAWNRHILGKNLTDAQQPAYSNTLATYTSNLYSAIGTAGTTSAAQATPTYFNRADYYLASVWKIEALKDGTYISLVHSRQKQNLMNLGDTASLASLQRTALSAKYADMAFGMDMGRIGSIQLMEDPRSPILVRDTADTSVTAYYRDVGSTDSRTSYSNTGTTTVYDVIGFYGRMALARGRMMKLRYDDELSDVGRIRQLVASQTYGVQSVQYDNTTATATSQIGQNSAVGFCYSGTVTT